MNTESQQQEWTTEWLRQYLGGYSSFELQLKAIVKLHNSTLAAIEQAHQNGWHEGRNYEAKFGVKPQCSEQQEWNANHDGMGEWAVYYGNETLKGWSGRGRILVSGLSETQAKTLTTAHNSALATERQKFEALADTNDGLIELVNTERQRREQLTELNPEPLSK